MHPPEPSPSAKRALPETRAPRRKAKIAKIARDARDAAAPSKPPGKAQPASKAPRRTQTNPLGPGPCASKTSVVVRSVTNSIQEQRGRLQTAAAAAAHADQRAREDIEVLMSLAEYYVDQQVPSSVDTLSLSLSPLVSFSTLFVLFCLCPRPRKTEKAATDAAVGDDPRQVRQGHGRAQARVRRVSRGHREDDRESESHQSIRYGYQSTGPSRGAQWRVILCEKTHKK